jgi:hypothetical protein
MIALGYVRRSKESGVRAVSLEDQQGRIESYVMRPMPHSPSPTGFARYAPELPGNVEAGRQASDHLVGDGVSWPDVTERQRLAMIIANGGSGSNED